MFTAASKQFFFSNHKVYSFSADILFSALQKDPLYKYSMICLIFWMLWFKNMLLCNTFMFAHKFSSLILRVMSLLSLYPFWESEWFINYFPLWDTLHKSLGWPVLALCLLSLDVLWGLAKGFILPGQLLSWSDGKTGLRQVNFNISFQLFCHFKRSQLPKMSCEQ